MKRLLLVLLLSALVSCTEKVEVTINAPSSGWEVCGADAVWVACRPFRDISYVELLVDGVVVGADTFPGPASGFEWDVRQLPEASVHSVWYRVTRTRMRPGRTRSS